MVGKWRRCLFIAWLEEGMEERGRARREKNITYKFKKCPPYPKNTTHGKVFTGKNSSSPEIINSTPPKK